jgi:hypothetical protein
MSQAPDAKSSSQPKYQPKTGNDLLSHPLPAESRTGDSLDGVLAAPSSREQVPGLDQYLGRDDRLSSAFRSFFVSNDVSAGWVSLD